MYNNVYDSTQSINVAVRIDTVFSWTCIGNSSGNLKIMGYWHCRQCILTTQMNSFKFGVFHNTVNSLGFNLAKFLCCNKIMCEQI